MDIISRGSKPVAYKSSMRLKFFSSAAEDSRVKVTSLFTRIVDRASVVVFGEYSIFLLFSYIDSRGQKVFVTESQPVRFNELIFCRLPEDTGIGLLEPQATFEPHINCVQMSGNVWNVEVEGEFDVLVYGDRSAPDTHPASLRTGVQNYADGTTVLRIDSNSLSAEELLGLSQPDGTGPGTPG